MTVLLTLAVPKVADPEDAAALVADAAATTALEVRHAVGVEGHLPTPGATVVRPGRRQPWQVVTVTADTLRLRDLLGHHRGRPAQRPTRPAGRRRRPWSLTPSIREARGSQLISGHLQAIGAARRKWLDQVGQEGVFVAALQDGALTARAHARSGVGGDGGRAASRRGAAARGTHKTAVEIVRTPEEV